MAKAKEVLTFKIDGSVVKALKGIENRSEFIRSAIAAALESACPFCAGSGILTSHKKKHWDQMVKRHKLSICKKCDTPVLECKHE